MKKILTLFLIGALTLTPTDMYSKKAIYVDYKNTKTISKPRRTSYEDFIVVYVNQQTSEVILSFGCDISNLNVVIYQNETILEEFDNVQITNGQAVVLYLSGYVVGTYYLSLEIDSDTIIEYEIVVEE